MPSPLIAVHLMVPYAFAEAAPCAAALATVALPNLQDVLNRLGLTLTDSVDPFCHSPPHERALARAHGLAAPDGQLPWAALQARRLGVDASDLAKAWASITPCHWHVAADHISMNAVELGEAESQALCAAMAPWFVQDGITLHYGQPNQWLACGEVFRGLATASLDRVLGRNIDAWMPEGAQAAPLRRLQNEMQMLLYHHAVNDARAERGALPVNSFWISGTGALPPDFDAREPAGLRVADALRAPALAGDWAAWAQAWQALDASECKELLDAMRAGHAVQLTLCGEKAAQSFGPARSGVWRRVTNVFARESASNRLGML